MLQPVDGFLVQQLRGCHVRLEEAQRGHCKTQSQQFHIDLLRAQQVLEDGRILGVAVQRVTHCVVLLQIDADDFDAVSERLGHHHFQCIPEPLFLLRRQRPCHQHHIHFLALFRMAYHRQTQNTIPRFSRIHSTDALQVQRHHHLITEHRAELLHRIRDDRHVAGLTDERLVLSDQFHEPNPDSRPLVRCRLTLDLEGRGIRYFRESDSKLALVPVACPALLRGGNDGLHGARHHLLGVDSGPHGWLHPGIIAGLLHVADDLPHVHHNKLRFEPQLLLVGVRQEGSDLLLQ
mmetsp:Transcript_41523/g.99560  ORF Transcript_41523/g.99560 Transcript_41523/m.99560 type:complete len:291 (+) Transcript_41523:761-1633(+)